MKRRSFIQAAGTALLAFFGGRGRDLEAAAYDAFEKTLAELQADLAAGRTTAVDLVRFYHGRIAAYDQAGPRLNAVLSLNSNAIADARALDVERRTSGARGPLHGIPVLLKDNFDTHDMPTTGGCLALSGMMPKADAFQVARLRTAGVVILGKVNLHELALGLTTISSLGGQTLDPYDPTRAPGGSSGGSGVAASANFAAFTMGTDTSGSIRIPSSHNAIVGLRPSAGLSSRAGIIPFGHTQDTGGPMARTVADVAIVLDATVGYDPADPITVQSNARMPRTYTSSLNRAALATARVGILAEFFGAAPEDQEVAVIVRAAVDEMRRRGATAIEITVPNLAGQLAASNLLVQELKFYLGDYLKASGAPVNSVEQMLASGLHAAQLQGILDAANAQPDDYLSSDDYRNRLGARDALGRAVLQVMDDNRLDAIVYPTVRRIAPVVGGNQAGSNAGLSAQTGFPAISVPAGFTSGGFPVGIELLGRRFGEPTLIGLAYAYEQATRHRRPPASVPRVDPRNRARPAAVSSFDVRGGSLHAEVAATGEQSAPPSGLPFQAIGRFSFNGRTRELAYALSVSGASPDQAGGAYLHRRTSRPNGGVACILAKSFAAPVAGTVVLLEPDAEALKAGRCYLSVVSRNNPLLAVRSDIVLRSAG